MGDGALMLDHLLPWVGQLTVGDGRVVHPFEPNESEFAIDDIARALSNTCRYHGHTEFYSVAEHSVLVSLVVEHQGGTLDEIRAGLMHDAAEAYFGDMAAPLKLRPELAAYREAEERLRKAIFSWLDLPEDIPAIVEDTDKAIRADECYALRIWAYDGSPLIGAMVAGVSPSEARRWFMNRYDLLWRGVRL